jgi:hypothetical protein
MPRLGSRPGLAGTAVSRTSVARTVLAGTIGSGTSVARTSVARTVVTGSIGSGTTVARTMVAGDMLAGDMVAGDMVAGTGVTWPMLRLASRFVSRPGPVRLRPPILARSRPGYRHGRNGRLAGPPRRGRLGGADGRRTRDGGQPGGGYLLRLTG